MTQSGDEFPAYPGCVTVEDQTGKSLHDKVVPAVDIDHSCILA